MTTIPELNKTLHHLLTTTANEVAKKTGFIQRQRQVTGAGFAQALVWGGLAHGETTRKQLHLYATQAGMKVSVQGLDQRFDSQAVQMMRELLVAGLKEMVQSEASCVILPQFNGVYLTDCTRLVWEKAGEKLAVRLELQRGQINACLMDLRQNDQRAQVVDQPLPRGALHLGDLGFFKLKRFRDWTNDGIYWLTRYKIGTRLHTLEGQPIDLNRLLIGDDAFTIPVRMGMGASASNA